MAFVNQVQPSQFFNQHLKVLQVVHKQVVNEFGDLTIPLAGVNAADIGLVQVTNIVAGTPEITVMEALPGKIVNIGFVPVTLTITVLDIIDLVGITVNVPFQAVIETPGVLPGDNIQKHDIQVLGVIDTPVTLFEIVDGVLEVTVGLQLKVVVELCLVVAREEILKVNAATTFC